MAGPLMPGALAALIDTRERLRSHHYVEQKLYGLLGVNMRRVNPLAPFALKKKLKERPGGGTPTVLTTGHFARILEALRANFNLLPDCEISVETTQQFVALRA